MNKILKTLRKVYSNWKYFILLLVISSIFYTLNVIISGWSSILNFYINYGFLKSLKFFSILLIGFKDTISLSSYYSLILISILFGIFLSLLFYKIRYNNCNNVGVIGGIGLFVAAFAPGCAACGIGLASILGLSAGFLYFLPYKGLELSILAILFLGFSITKLSNNIYKCDLPIKQMKGGREK